MKTKKAVALQYNPESQDAPKVIAKGAGFVAENILKKAAESGEIPVYEDAALVESLTKIELNNHIPPELYEVVAQVLIFIADLDKESHQHTPAPPEKPLPRLDSR